jgi:3-methyladenine DNA glycosylase Tag
MQTFKSILAQAAARKGSETLESLLPEPKTDAQLQSETDDRYLAEMTKAVFRSGFVWKIIENKWPGFEEAFEGFDTMSCAMLSDEDLEVLSQDTRIVRNAKKIGAVRGNAQFVRDVKGSHGGFGAYLAAWPEDDIVGLWAELKRRGERLGGNTGPYFLRFIGKDTFMLSADVVAALVGMGIVDKAPTSKKALAAVQDAFNQWREQSGRPLCQISRVLACSVG